jgi:hypothetical protein
VMDRLTQEMTRRVWRAVITGPRASGLPFKREHAEHIEQHLDQHGAMNRSCR